MKSLEQKFNELKARHPEALLLFRCGDFYECYSDDAVKAADLLHITLTKRTTGAAMAGFPRHALDTFLPTLIHAGIKVAICDDLGGDDADSIAERNRVKDLTEYMDANLTSEDMDEFQRLKAIKTTAEREEFLKGWRAILRDMVNEWAIERKIAGDTEPYYKAIISTITNPDLYK